MSLVEKVLGGSSSLSLKEKISFLILKKNERGTLNSYSITVDSLALLHLGTVELDVSPMAPLLDPSGFCAL